ncbi:MAG: AMP-binding protein, partial [Clostridia bacterium]|nr:AMP-binding protein [Clostridia bacterium]
MSNRKKSERNYTPVESMQNFVTKLASFGDRTAYRYFDRQHNLHSITYRNLSAKFAKTAAGYTKAGLAGKRIAIIGETSVEWVSAYIGTIAAGGIAIPMDRELDLEQIKGFLEFAEADAIVYSYSFNEKFADLAATHPTVTMQIPMDPERGTWEQNESILPFAKLLEMGEDAIKEGYALPEAGDPDRMIEMLFTSGTTGTSKCVALSEKNILAAVNAACESVDFSPEDSIVSVLPIHHTYELCIMLAALNYGMNVAINDSLKKVLKNFALFKPTGLVLVPLFVSTMNKKIWEEAKKGKKDKVLRSMTKVSRVMRHVNIDVRDTLFKQVKAAFGGRLCKIVCGATPLNPDMVEAFEEFGILISEGYGITECSPLVSVNPYFAPKRGSVGPAVDCCEVIIDAERVNDLGYNEGEILVKGDNVMLGYYKNPEATAAAFTVDGYFRTGDSGYMDEDGYIYITGRKKSVIVLENGKNVFPEEIEEYLSRLETVGESVVVGRKKED